MVTIATSFDTMGLLVYRGITPFDLVLDLAGGIVAIMHRKLARYHRELRVEQNQPSYAEWFDWLGQQAEQFKPVSTTIAKPATHSLTAAR